VLIAVADTTVVAPAAAVVTPVADNVVAFAGLVNFSHHGTRTVQPPAMIPVTQTKFCPACHTSNVPADAIICPVCECSFDNNAPVACATAPVAHNSATCANDIAAQKLACSQGQTA